MGGGTTKATYIAENSASQRVNPREVELGVILLLSGTLVGSQLQF